MRVTHEVTNQVPPLIDYDAADYPPILEALQREGAHDALDDLHHVGRLAGGAEAQRWGDLAEAHPPVLRTHDRYGHRIDEVEYDPAYHRLMSTAVELGLHGAPWADPGPHAHLVRAAKMAVWGQVDAGHGCPISMTYAVVPALRHNPELALQYEPLLTSRVYDP
ncbi:MAG: DNA alkylation response protein, partial [Nocardiaceae bacterium]|nr:DNA alkylation response protein [Nocardiaceae bacterium]